MVEASPPAYPERPVVMDAGGITVRLDANLLV
jgi:hypothetical protein